MPFPIPGQTIYGAWTQEGEGYADQKTRFTRLNTKLSGLACDSVTDDRAALNTLVNVTMQATGGGQLDVVGIVRIGSNMTIPANITLNFLFGAYLAPDNGVTLTDLSQNARRIRQRRYASTGTIIYGFDGPVFPEWWGAKADNVADDSAAIMAASIAVPTSNVQGGAVEFAPGAVYKVSNSVVVASKYHLRWYAHAQATINVQVGAGLWGVDINLAPLAPDYASFSTANISIVDLNQTRTRKGMRLARCLEGKFDRLWMYGFTTMMDAKTDSDHNVFVNCFFSNNSLCHTSSDGVAVDNIFIGCNWLSSDVAFDGTWSETNILGGTMEPANGAGVNPFFVTGDNCHAYNLRFERNTNNQEWMRVGSSCDIECSFQGDGAHQALPAIRFFGSESTVKARVGTVAQLAIFDAVSARNKLVIQGPTLLLNQSVYMLDNAPTAGNIVETALGIMGTDVQVQKVPGSLVTSALDDAATWVRANMTSVLPNGPDYQAIASGAGAPSLTATLVGNFPNLYLAFTGRYNNIAGDITVTVNGTQVIGASLSPTRRRVYLAFKGPFVNPTIQLAMGGSGAGSAFTIGALSVSDKTFSASNDPADPRFFTQVCTGDPNGQLFGSPGMLAVRRDGGAATALYVKESGINTSAGWVPLISLSGATMTGALNIANYLQLSGTAAGVAGSIFKNAGDGLIIQSVNGVTYDFALYTPAAGYIARVPHGTTNFDLVGNLLRGGTQIATARQTGWAAQTTALARADMGGAPTLATVASTLAALITDMRTHGLIGT